MGSWIHLTLALQIFYAVGIIAGLVLLIEVVLTMFGMDHHNAVEAAFDHPDDFGVLTVRTVTGFFFGFGWAGVIALKSGWNVLAAIAAACVAGAAFLFAIYALMRALFSMRSSGNLDYSKAIGLPATVYVTIPPARSGVGQVEIYLQGRLATVSSMTTHASALAPQTKVKVTDLIDQTTLNVEPA